MSQLASAAKVTRAARSAAQRTSLRERTRFGIRSLLHLITMQRVGRSLRAVAASHVPLLVQGRVAGRTLWSAVQEAPKDPILGVSERFVACTVPLKMNLGVVRPM